MSELSRDDVIATFGQLDDATIAKIISTGATIAELKAAHEWVTRDANRTIGDKSMGPSPIASVIEIIQSAGDSILGNSGSTLT